MWVGCIWVAQSRLSSCSFGERFRQDHFFGMLYNLRVIRVIIEPYPVPAPPVELCRYRRGCERVELRFEGLRALVENVEADSVFAPEHELFGIRSNHFRLP